MVDWENPIDTPSKVFIHREKKGLRIKGYVHTRTPIERANIQLGWEIYKTTRSQSYIGGKPYLMLHKRSASEFFQL